MIALIVGTPDSGKSARAEDLVLRLACDRPKIYLATMRPYGEEGLRRVQKHRLAREGKGFVTLERETDLHALKNEFAQYDRPACLLECVSNLVGNEMWLDENRDMTEMEVVAKVVGEIMELETFCETLVVVTNEFELDSLDYDDSTRRYVSIISKVNDTLRAISDRVEELEGGEWRVHEAC